MQTTNDFSLTFTEYFASKPNNLSNFSWLFDRTNPNYFSYWVSDLINKIHSLSILRGFSFCTQKVLALMIGKSTRTLSDILSTLVDIKVLDVQIIKKNKQYKVNWGFLRSGITTVHQTNNIETSAITSSIFEQNFSENPFESIDCSYENFATIREDLIDTRSYNHQVVEDLPISDSKTEVREEKSLPSNLVKLDPVEIEIKQNFEAITGNKLNLAKNSKPLAELKKLALEAKSVVVEAFRQIASFTAETNQQIYSLGYVVATAKNLLKTKTASKKARLSTQDRANLAVGGNPANYVAPAPTAEQQAQQLEQQKIALEIAQRNEILKTNFYNDLPDEVKAELIQQEIASIKTQPAIWEKLKPKFPWFDDSLVKGYAVNKIKDNLLQEHLEYQEFLTTV